MTVADVSALVTQADGVANVILESLAQADPEVAVPAHIAEQVALLVSKGLAAYAAASGRPITPATIAALMPNPTPLTPPTK